jgi:PTH1 family peptidyl-tRNA hydrolase
MKLVVGLGNPGEEYARMRHNVGYAVIDRLAESEGIAFSRKKFSSLMAEGVIEGTVTVLLKPLTYMNESGRAVREAVQYLALSSEQFLIVCDDLALPLARLRFRARGSSGGHNGLKSVARELGSDRFERLRIGIGGPGRMDPEKYVLRRFKRAELKTVEEMIEDAQAAVRYWLSSDIQECMNRFN